MQQPRMGSLLPPFGPALLGQQLAQPRMLVVHVLPPSVSEARFLRSGTFRDQSRRR